MLKTAFDENAVQMGAMGGVAAVAAIRVLSAECWVLGALGVLWPIGTTTLHCEHYGQL
jgi:hypothetical protein